MYKDSIVTISKDASICEKPEAKRPVNSIKSLSFKIPKQEIKVNDILPYGVRLFQNNPENVVRMKDIGQNKRLLLIGVLGSFTPDCWNRHLHQVLQKLQYYEERNVDHICCVSTNDPYTHSAWGRYLGCDQKILMWSDVTTNFTTSIGMSTAVPWLDSSLRSRRYVLLADDMVVKKMITAPDRQAEWFCDHLTKDYDEEEGENDEN